MLAAIAANPDTAPLLPMLRGLYGTPSTYLWYDQHSNPHTVLQGDGGEQGDPLMPAMFSLALHTALTSISPHLQPGETLLAYLDDLYVVSTPHRTVPIFNLLQANLDAHAGISLHLGKTRVWNAAGEEPTDIHLLQPTPPAAPHLDRQLGFANQRARTPNPRHPPRTPSLRGRGLARQTRRTSSAPDRDPYY